MKKSEQSISERPKWRDFDKFEEFENAMNAHCDWLQEKIAHETEMSNQTIALMIRRQKAAEAFAAEFPNERREFATQDKTGKMNIGFWVPEHALFECRAAFKLKEDECNKLANALRTEGKETI